MMKMLVIKFVIMSLVCAHFLAPLVQATPGRAVFYNPPYTKSACYGRQTYGNLVAGAKGWLYNNGAACGRRYRVRCLGPTYGSGNACTGRTVDVTIVDLCRETCNGDLNLSLDAFKIIANPYYGNIRVDYTPI